MRTGQCGGVVTGVTGVNRALVRDPPSTEDPRSFLGLACVAMSALLLLGQE